MGEQETKEIQTHNTIFDDVFRTMVQKLPKLVIPVINEVFHTEYREDVPFTQLRNEFMEKQGKIITDSIFVISGKTYHLECQSTDDATMAIRMVEYDFSIALEQAQTKSGRRYEIDFPTSCVLYLRCGERTPDVLEVQLNFPDGTHYIYECRTMKLCNYTSDKIFEKNLLLLLPYYILKYENRKKSLEQNKEELEELLKEYEYIRDSLEKKLIPEEQSALYEDLCNLIIEISEYIFKEQEEVKKGVAEIMGGKVLELASERSERIGMEKGMKRGMERGMEKGMKHGMEKGPSEAISNAIDALMQSLGCSREEAKKYLKITDE